MIGRTATFICVRCNEIVPNPENVKGLLRCRNGHRVEGLKHRPIVLEAAISCLVAFCASGFLIGVGSALTGDATASAIAVAILCGAWSAFLLNRGFLYRRTAGAARELSPQYLGAGTVFSACAFLIGCGSIAGVFRW
jgi:hypothetical protein